MWWNIKYQGCGMCFWINAWLIRYHHPDIIKQMRKLTWFHILYNISSWYIMCWHISIASILEISSFCHLFLRLQLLEPFWEANLNDWKTNASNNKCFLYQEEGNMSQNCWPSKLTPWKLTAGIWVTAHLKISPSSSPFRWSTWVFTNSLDGDMHS